jgi:hypothetical protein
MPSTLGQRPPNKLIHISVHANNCRQLADFFVRSSHKIGRINSLSDPPIGDVGYSLENRSFIALELQSDLKLLLSGILSKLFGSHAYVFIT